MVTCQSANQLKTPAKVSWAFKMVSVWFTRLHNHREDCWSDSCPEDNHWHPSFCISFGDQGPRVWRKGGEGGAGGEAHSQSCLKSSVKFPQSVMIWGAMSSAGVGPLCFWKPTSLHPFTKKFWSTSCFLLMTSFLKMLISISSRIWHLPTLPKAPKVG